MNRETIWWRGGGPAGLLSRISRAVGQAARVVFVLAPDPSPRGFVDALDDELRRTLSLTSRHVDVSRESQQGSLPHLVAEKLDVTATEIASLADFADHPKLADTVAVIDGLDPREVRRWALFLRALNAKPNGTLLGPVLVILVPRGLTKAELKELRGRAMVLSMMGAVSRYDTAAYLSQIGVRADHDLVSRVALSVTIDVAAWSRDLLDTIIGWSSVDQIAPFVALEKLGRLSDHPYPCFENGLVDLWDDEPAAHAAAAMIHGLSNHVRRRVWAAQAGILLPFTYRILQGFVLRYRDVLDRRVSVANPYIKIYNEREVKITDPRKLEFYDVATLVSHVMPEREKNLLEAARWARHSAAHRSVVKPDDVSTLSDHYEANRDLLENDIPGWDWPRCGQQLSLTIGPPAAGKSHWAQKQGVAVVSSDEIRKELTGTLEYPEDQSTIFRAVRDRAKDRLASGESVIIDAMNLQPEHRRWQVDIAPRDIRVRYVVIDRPLADKLRDAGWRAEKGLVEKYHKDFQERIDYVLEADRTDEIEVLDLREISKLSPVKFDS